MAQKVSHCEESSLNRTKIISEARVFSVLITKLAQEYYVSIKYSV